MPPAVLIVASTRVHVDAQEILRIQDTASVLLDGGFSVDILVPRVSPLLSAALPSAARVFAVPRVPFCDAPPNRPSIRRLLTGVVMFFRGVALAAKRDYAILHGVNDGALVVRAIDRATVRRLPYVAEVHVPLTAPGFFKGPRAALAGRFERSALRHAGAIVLPDEETLRLFGDRIPKARVSLIPDPHAEIAPDAFTYAEFATALEHVYAYVLRPQKGK